MGEGGMDGTERSNMHKVQFRLMTVVVNPRLLFPPSLFSFAAGLLEILCLRNSEDMYAHDSIQLLKNSGIDFEVNVWHAYVRATWCLDILYFDGMILGVDVPTEEKENPGV